MSATLARVGRLVVVSGASILALASTSTSPAGTGAEAQPAATETCPPVLVLANRGSGDSLTKASGLGAPGLAFTDRLTELIRGTDWWANDYDAVGVFSFDLRRFGDIINGGGAITKLSGPGLGAYHDSVVGGKERFAAKVAEVMEKCGAETALVLVGFSQGAQVAADVYQSDLTDEQQRRVAAVVLFGDPYFHGGDRQVSRGSFSGRRDGLLGRRPAFGNTGSTLVLSYCHSHDPVCQGLFHRVGPTRTLDPGALTFRQHLNYTGFGEPEQAAELVAKLAAVREAVRRADSAASRLTPGQPGAQQLDIRPIVLVVDVSGSMSNDDGSGRIKLNGAKTALIDFISAVEPGTLVGMRTYPSPEEDCGSGTGSTIAPIETGALSSAIRALVPDGDTPTAEAIRAAAADLRSDGYSGGSLVIVSDGESTCEDPCVAAQEIEASGFDIQALTVGFKISDEGREQLGCIANATGGTYVDVDNSQGLAEAMTEMSRPAVTVDLTYPTEVVAEVGSEASGLVRVTATVRNTTQQLAKNVTARLRFDTADAPGVPRPLQALGNLGADVQREVVWAFRPGVLLAGKTIRLTVVTRADNISEDVVADAAIDVADRSSRTDAGPLLRDRARLAVLGDSYSAGEGADTYEPERGALKGCHRSKLTYLVPEFGDSVTLACSGAVSNDIQNRDKQGLDAQAQQLRAAQDDNPVDLVALTLGGNDADFTHLAYSCLALGAPRLPKDCSSAVKSGLFGSETSAQFMASRLTSDLAAVLVESYSAINWAVNTSKDVRARGAVAPILVLAYPLPLPLTGRTCWPLANQLTRGEVRFIGEFVVRLNGLIEAAVRQARERHGVPVFYVSNTEDAFQPDRTVCDGQPFARALNSFNGQTRELIHPNRDGYKAMTAAVVRWSLGPEAKEAERFLVAALASDAPALSRQTLSSVDLGRLQGGDVQIQPGRSYPVTVEGFDPSTPIAVEVRSKRRLLAQSLAGRDGVVRVRVAFPAELEAGAHTLRVGGFRRGEPRAVEIGVRIERGWPWQKTALAALVVLGGAGAMLLWIVVVLGARRAIRNGQQAVVESL